MLATKQLNQRYVVVLPQVVLEKNPCYRDH